VDQGPQGNMFQQDPIRIGPLTTWSDGSWSLGLDRSEARGVAQDDELLIRCDCYDHEHHAFLYYCADDDLFYLNVHLSRGGVLHRIRTAWRYLFAPRWRHGCYDEYVLSSGTATSMARFINLHTMLSEHRRPT
jgi:hypothetical protein